MRSALLIGTVILLGLLYASGRRTRLRVKLESEGRVAGLLQHLSSIASARARLTTESLIHRTQETADMRTLRTVAFLQLLVNETRVMFDGYTGRPCSVAIKLLTPSTTTGAPLIRTYLRDERSDPVRRDVYQDERPYPYTDHSPFAEILSGETSGDFFLCNDLRRAWADGKYRNSNAQWWRFYDATLVVPIKAPGTYRGENIAGFLCIDSLGAKFDATAAPLLAQIVASSAFLALNELSILEHERFDTKPNNGRQGAKAG